MLKAKHLWFRPRGYAHFDAPLEAGAAEELARRFQQTGKHDFKPLIWYNEVSRVRRKGKRPCDPAGVVVPQPTTGSPRGKLAQASKLRPREELGEGTDHVGWKPKRRPIARAAHTDAAIYDYYHYVVRAHYDRLLRGLGLDEAVIGYRRIPRPGSDRGKASFDFAAEAFAEICRIGPCGVACLDIKGFFDHVPHDALKQQYARVLGCQRLDNDHFRILQSITRYSRIPLAKLRSHLSLSHRTYRRMCRFARPFPSDCLESLRTKGMLERVEKGIPQGLPVSGLFANIAMLAFDEEVFAAAAVAGGLYRRYSDDILLVAPPEVIEGLVQIAREAIGKLGMTIPAEKSTEHAFVYCGRTLSTKRPLSYLGLEFDGARVLIRSQTMARFDKRMKRAIRREVRRAAGLWDRLSPLRIKRQHLYNLYTPLPYRPVPTVTREWRGNFAGYAKHTRSPVLEPWGVDISRAVKQLRRAMARMDKFIVAEERAAMRGVLVKREAARRRALAGGTPKRRTRR